MSESDPLAPCARLLRERFAQILGRDGRAAALIGAQEGQNCGQHANWLGALKLLREMGTEPVILPRAGAFEPDALRQRLVDGVVLLSGALTADPVVAQHFARVITSLPNKIIFLPERIRSGWKPQPDLASAISSHSDVVFLARDPTARQQIEQAFAAGRPIELTPPPSIALGPQERKVRPQYDIVWVARTGRRDNSAEAAARLSSQSAERLELPDFPDGIAIDAVVRQRPPTVMLTDWSSLVFRHQEARIAADAVAPEIRAQAYTDRALYIMSLCRTAITDRAGGHIFCLLLRIPHVFVENGSGANRALFESWSGNAEFCSFAETPAEAWAQARSMLHELDESEKRPAK
jgi:exopolysaccharide biosynthesis predicted pyruvyltransferase EpsI